MPDFDEWTLAVFGDDDDGLGVPYRREKDPKHKPPHDRSDGMDREWQEILSGRSR